MHPYSSGQERYEHPPSTDLGGMDTGLRPTTGMVLRRTEHQALYLQFQNRYPLGALISELLQIQDGKFIVRVQAQVGGSTLSTGLSAAYTPEMAEDQARLRALEVLGVYPTSGYSTQEVKAELISGPRSLGNATQGQFQPQPQRYSQGQLASASYPEIVQANYDQATLRQDHTTGMVESPVILQQTLMDWADEPQAAPPETLNSTNTSPQLPIFNAGRHPESDQRPTSPAAPTPPKRSSRPASGAGFGAGSGAGAGKAATSSPPRQHPLDLSDVIAQTSVEVKRLQWTEVQGRQHLQKQYGKRSRQQLTDEELIDFLKFLEAQPTPSQALR